MWLYISVKWAALGQVTGQWTYQLNSLLHWRWFTISVKWSASVEVTGHIRNCSIWWLNTPVKRTAIQSSGWIISVIPTSHLQTSYFNCSPEKKPVIEDLMLKTHILFVLLLTTKLSVKIVFLVIFKHKNEYINFFIKLCPPTDMTSQKKPL